jgi:site-specific DNA-methyltransferase (adenine-specific)
MIESSTVGSDVVKKVATEHWTKGLLFQDVTQKDRVGNGSSLVYVNENGVFFKSDCLKLLKGIKSNSINLCFTDPPFNLGKPYEDTEFDDRLGEQTYYKWCKDWLSELIRVLVPGGTLCVYVLPKLAINLSSWLNLRADVTYRSLIAVKMKSGFPIKGRLHPALYTILYYVKRGALPTFNVVRHKARICKHCGKEICNYGGYRKKYEKYEDESGVPWIQISDFWEDTRPARQDKSRKSQVNELPLHIPERIILMASREGDVVLDVLGGGGSTYHAAQMHGRLWIGCDRVDTPALSRFATLWGRNECDQINSKVLQCFEDNFINYYLEEKKKNRMYPIESANLLTNGRSLTKKDVVSKSRVLR